MYENRLVKRFCTYCGDKWDHDEELCKNRRINARKNIMSEQKTMDDISEEIVEYLDSKLGYDLRNDNPSERREVLSMVILTMLNINLYDISDLQSENEMLKAEREWISVDDRLPENDDDVLVCLRDEEIKVDWYDNQRQYWMRCDTQVTHWMPLPLKP